MRTLTSINEIANLIINANSLENVVINNCSSTVSKNLNFLNKGITDFVRGHEITGHYFLKPNVTFEQTMNELANERGNGRKYGKVEKRHWGDEIVKNMLYEYNGRFYLRVFFKEESDLSLSVMRGREIISEKEAYELVAEYRKQNDLKVPTFSEWRIKLFGLQINMLFGSMRVIPLDSINTIEVDGVKYEYEPQAEDATADELSDEMLKAITKRFSK